MPEQEPNAPTDITWTAPEYIHYPKSLLWFIGAGVIGLGLAAYFFFRKDFLTGTLFLLLLVILIYFSKARPREMKIELGVHGVKINQMRLSYQQLRSFWIVYDPPDVKTLNLETSARLNRYLTLQLESQDPVAVRRFLLEYLPEDLEKGEQFADKLSRTLKF